MKLIQHLKIVFIVGSQRTGTTMVGNILGAHPQAYLIDEPDGLYPWIDAIFANSDCNKVNLLFRQCCLKARNNYINPNDKCSQDGVLSSGISHLILKAPNLTFSADKISEFFPNQFCVFTYRDIRDVVVSMSKLNWIPMVKNQLDRIQASNKLVARFKAEILALNDPQQPLHQSRAYISVIKTQLRDTFNKPQINKLEVRYEDFVCKPTKLSNNIFEHIQLPEFSQTISHTKVMSGWGPGLTYRQSKINTHSVGQWKKHLTHKQESEVWAIAGDVMRELKYVRKADNIPKQTLWSGLSSDIKHQPIIATGRGGSGTRLLSILLQNLNIFIGHKHQVTEDSLEWVSVLYKIAIERNRGQQSGAPIGHWHDTLQEIAADILIRNNWDGAQQWGWKLPESMMCLPEIFDAFSQGKLIHIVRHPVDISLRRSHMTSRVSNEMGKSVLQAAYENLNWNQNNIQSDPEYLLNAASWHYQVGSVVKFGRNKLNSQNYLELRYEDICDKPVAILNQLRSFIGGHIPRHSTNLNIDQQRRKAWSSPDPRANIVWEICGELAIKLGYLSVDK